MVCPGPESAVTDRGERKTGDLCGRRTKDVTVISATDIDLLPLRGSGGRPVTDDFAIQNVALVLGVKTVPILQRKARRVHWKYRCSGCGRYAEQDGECPVCGAGF